MFKYLLMAIFTCSQVWSLEIDDKLTLRILDTSKTKKTVLINRGIEDGISVGDHAKFYLTSGVIARGLVVKASPTRSIWSLYRLSKPEKILKQRVMNLKISTPVKLTNDPSKMLATTNDELLNDPEAEGLSSNEKDELKTLSEEQSIYGTLMAPKKSLELYSLLNFNGMSTSSDAGTSGTSSGRSAAIDFSAGFEKYFSSRTSWFHNISLFVLIHNSQKEVTSVEGNSVSESAFEFGGGVRWHFLADPFTLYRLIGFASFAFGVGSASDSQSTGSSENNTYEGSASFISLGAGVKYYFKNHFGFRAMVDYYRRSEVYVIEGEDSDYSKIIAGPRMMVGLSYRF